MAFRDINPAPMNPLAWGELAQAPAANFLAGQQQATQDALLQREVARDDATRAALAGYFQAPPDQQPALLNELAGLDPAAATQVMQIQQAQAAQATAQRQQQALQDYADAQYVLGSQTPALALRLLDKDGEFLRQLEDAGLVDSADGISDDEARLIAQWARDQAAPIAGIQAAEPDAFARKLMTTEGYLGRPLTDAEIMQMAGGGTTINIGDQLAEPIPISSIQNVRLPDGSAVPIGTTFEEARAMGAQVFSAEEQKRTQQADAAIGILDEIESLALGEGGVFEEVEPGFASRAEAAVRGGINKLTQADSKSARYDDLVNASLSPFIKFLGESGALADGDVQRGLGLMPRTFPLPDTREVAGQKLRQVREILERGVRNLRNGERAQTPAPTSVRDMSDDQLMEALRAEGFL